MKDTRQMAFWKYNGVPFALCGEVEVFREDGGVQVKGYSGYFRADSILKIVPYSQGVKLKKRLLKEEARYHKVVREATKRMKLFVDTNIKEVQECSE